VHHELQPLLGRPGHVDLVALLEQALVGVHHLEGLGGVAGEDQDFGHCGTPAVGKVADVQERWDRVGCWEGPRTGGLISCRQMRQNGLEPHTDGSPGPWRS
jgi:hypothetical protein